MLAPPPPTPTWESDARGGGGAAASAPAPISSGCPLACALLKRRCGQEMDAGLARLLGEWRLDPAELRQAMAALGVTCVEVGVVCGGPVRRIVEG